MRNLEKHDTNTKKAAETITNLSWMTHILYKMKMQWKTLKQGFKALNTGQ